MTDWEIWAHAAGLRTDHGELDGSVEAANRAVAMLKAGDEAGYYLWIQIMVCIPKLGRLIEADEAQR